MAMKREEGSTSREARRSPEGAMTGKEKGMVEVTEGERGGEIPENVIVIEELGRRKEEDLVLVQGVGKGIAIATTDNLKEIGRETDTVDIEY